MEIKSNRLKTYPNSKRIEIDCPMESIVNSTWFFGVDYMGFANPKSGTIPSIFHKN